MTLKAKFKETNKKFNADFCSYVDLNADTYKKGYNQGYEDGKNSVFDASKFCSTIRFRSFNVFNTSEVVLNLDNVTILEYLVDTSNSNTYPDKINTTVEYLTINAKRSITDVYRMFRCTTSGLDRYLKRITLNFNLTTESNWRLREAFYGLYALEIIDGVPLDLSCNTDNTNAFWNCVALKEIRFKPNTIKVSINFGNCGKLTAETIQSIVDGFADMTGQTSPTLTVHKTVGEKMTDEQKATLTAKNVILVY